MLTPNNSLSIVNHNSLNTVFNSLEYSLTDASNSQALGQLLEGRKAFESKLYRDVSSLVPINDRVQLLAYLKSDNMLITRGYTSCAGNTYQEGFRFSKSIAIKTHIGHGYKHTFLNGIELYSADGNRKLLAYKSYHCCFYSEISVAHQAIMLLTEYLKTLYPNVHETELRVLATSSIKEAYMMTQLRQLDGLNNRLGSG